MSKKLEEVLAKLNSKYDKGTVMLLDENSDAGTYKRIPTGSLGLDKITGGGYPLGRIIEFIGWESSGKSSCCFHAIAEAQKLGYQCAFIDVEQAFDSKYAKALGIDLTKLILVQPTYGEEALEIARELTESGEVQLIMIDSVATLIPKTEMEAEVGDNQMGLQARMMSKACRMLSPVANKNECCIIFTNQYRQKIGVMFGDDRIGSGGNALKYYASIRLEFTGLNSKTESNKEGEKTAKMIKAKCLKNKTANPFGEVYYMIEFGKGIDNIGEILDVATDLGIVNKKGAFYYYEDTKLGQGALRAKQLLADNLELLEEIKEQIR